jgi:hypothetical protein
MKYFLTAFFLFAAKIASAQIVNIPDPNFKQILLNYVPVIDINGNGEIEVSEAAVVTILQLPITSNSISDLTGVRSFINLQTFECYAHNISSLDLSNLLQLKSVVATYNYNLSSIDVSGCENLEFLSTESTSPGFMNLNFGSIRKLRGLALDARIVALDLTAFDSLSTLSFGIGEVGNLNISGLTKLESLVQFGRFGTLNARGCTGLKTLHSGPNAVTGISDFLDVTGCINLESIYIQETNLAVLDLSTCISLQDLSIFINTPGLQYLNLKNGSFATIDFQLSGGNPSIWSCIADFR